ncbi:hypothetical protein DQ04_02191130 [Trypanosoma grayi]|uniref:hypothetical protein n=1 Tax=Trypanosoma grayi TaxID=71804 RepID=UPI0004F42498|nr:hypothetical protein DQ04_02191130 [Trypanosoma grayi]KEG11881.1 hypothetical protein DQ04_02191130 [Trypanosoma grayi]
MAVPVPVQQSSSQYVSPTLGPTNPWAQQTSTGTFRPPNPPSPAAHHETSWNTVSEVKTAHSSSLQDPPCVMLMDRSPSYLHPALQSTGQPIEKIMSMIVSAVGQERDTFATQKETNRVLEQELRQVQKRREEVQRALREVQLFSSSLEALQKEQLELLGELRCQ